MNGNHHRQPQNKNYNTNQHYGIQDDPTDYRLRGPYYYVTIPAIQKAPEDRSLKG